MEKKSSNLNKRKVESPVRTVKELETMLEFVTSQIGRLQESGSQDKHLLDYLNGKKDQAIAEIARLKKEYGQ
ncbi:hypothetical protein HYW72_00730 [Candidatus Nomurabacteria bacterium]|nr:hypothetical protein [Candidatus Nomurabacteria bacterium]